MTGTFKHHCTCGGYAYDMNGRNPDAPHMAWCPQLEEYAQWVRAGRPDHWPPDPTVSECPYCSHTLETQIHYERDVTTNEVTYQYSTCSNCLNPIEFEIEGDHTQTNRRNNHDN